MTARVVQVAPNLRMVEMDDGSVVISGQWRKGARYEVMVDLESTEVDVIVGVVLGMKVDDVRARRAERGVQ